MKFHEALKIAEDIAGQQELEMQYRLYKAKGSTPPIDSQRCIIKINGDQLLVAESTWQEAIGQLEKLFFELEYEAPIKSEDMPDADGESEFVIFNPSTKLYLADKEYVCDHTSNIAKAERYKTYAGADRDRCDNPALKVITFESETANASN